MAPLETLTHRRSDSSAFASVVASIDGLVAVLTSPPATHVATAALPFPADVDPADLRVHHRSDAFDHRPLERDREVAFPISVLRELATEGAIGSLAPASISFMGSVTRPRRLIDETAWELCTLFDVNLRPRLMTVSQLETGLVELGRHLYSAEATKRRRAGFKEQWRAGMRARRTATMGRS